MGDLFTRSFQEFSSANHRPVGEIGAYTAGRIGYPKTLVGARAGGFYGDGFGFFMPITARRARQKGAQ